MTHDKSKFKTRFSVWVGISNIVCCIASIISCIIAYTAVEQIVSLNVEFQPIVEKFQKDSVIIEKIFEKPQLIIMSVPDSAYHANPIPPIVINPDVEKCDSSKYVPAAEVNDIMDAKNRFLKHMQPFIQKMKNL